MDTEARQREQQRRLAAALRSAQGPQGQMAGRFYVAPNPLQHLAALGSQFAGAHMDRRLDQEEAQAETKQREKNARLARALTGSEEPGAMQNPQQAAAFEAFSGLPLDAQEQFLGGRALQAIAPPAPKLRELDLGSEVVQIDEQGRIVNRFQKDASPDAQLSQEGQDRRHQLPSGSSLLSEQGAMQRHAMPSGSARLGADVSMRSQNITLRGQDLTDARGREQIELDRLKAGNGGKPLTEFQAKAVGQLSRMQGAEEVIGTMSDYIPSVTARSAAAVPGIGNKLTSEAFQNYQQAAREWISGVLRLDSGAAVPELEFDRYFATYFPQPGDGPDVVAQKTDARQRATEALRGSLSDISDRLPAPPMQRTQAPADEGDAQLTALMQQYAK